MSKPCRKCGQPDLSLHHFSANGHEYEPGVDSLAEPCRPDESGRCVAHVCEARDQARVMLERAIKGLENDLEEVHSSWAQEANGYRLCLKRALAYVTDSVLSKEIADVLEHEIG